MPRTIKVYCDDEFASDVPTRVIVEITAGLRKRILHMADVVKRENLYSATEFEYTPMWKDGRKETSMDCVELVVTADDFRWTAYLKHTNIFCHTENVRIETLMGKQPRRQASSKAPSTRAV
jgi:hypothetical protein